MDSTAAQVVANQTHQVVRSCRRIRRRVGIADSKHVDQLADARVGQLLQSEADLGERQVLAPQLLDDPQLIEMTSVRARPCPLPRRREHPVVHMGAHGPPLTSTDLHGSCNSS
jgi:hypothetical protein